MKFTVNLDCTPAEARAFLGLPDVAPLHDAWLAKAQSLMTEGMGAPDLERLTRAWTTPLGPEAIERFGRMFWPGNTPKP